MNTLYYLADTLIAGSIGPYGACLNDGSEFSGSYTENLSIQVDYTFFILEYNYQKNFKKLKQFIDWHRPRFECLIKSGCDLLAIETIPSIKGILI